MNQENHQHEYDVDACIEDLTECFCEPVPDQGLADTSGLDAVVEKARKIIVDPHLDGNHAAAASTAMFQSRSGDEATLPRAIAGDLGAAGYSVSRINLQDRKKGRYFQQHDRMIACLEALVETQPHMLIIDGVESLQVQRGDPLEQKLLDLSRGDDAVVVLGIDESQSDRRTQQSQLEQLVDVTFSIPTPDVDRRIALLETTVETAVSDVDRDLTVSSPAYERHAVELDGYNALWIRRVGKRAVTLAVAAQARSVTDEHLESAVEQIDDERPDGEAPWSGSRDDAANTEFVVDTPDVTFTDVGGLEKTIARIRELVAVRQNHREVFEEAGFSTSHGMLLAGPPGTGKTLLAKAVANELDRPFLSVKGPELKHPLYGMTERKIRNLFERADEEAPCVVFFDEFDAIASDRNEVSHTATESQVAALLTELDGIEEREDVLVLAATNRREAIDEAVLRQGRLGEVVEVPVPDASGQEDIFGIHADPLPLADDVTSSWFVAESPADITGADIAGICKEAFHAAVSDTDHSDDVRITRAHVRSAFDTVCPSAQGETTRNGFQ